MATPASPVPPEPTLLSQRVFTLQQVVPLMILATVMFYEVSTHLIFESSIYPIFFAMETVAFGIVGPALTWVTLNWVGREIAKRERAEGKADALNAMMQEMHHRIKNNLQTVADLLSLEMSRNLRPEVQESLRDSITRIKSIAASHEILSAENVSATDITELARLVSENSVRSMVRSDQQIEALVKGPAIYLASKQATAFALVLNELVSNAIEHGFLDQSRGCLEIELDQEGEQVWVRIQDNGTGLPPEFDLVQSRGLGLQIARTLVEKDLHGKLALVGASNKGTTAWVQFQRGVAAESEE